MLRLDEDFTGFHARCRESETHRQAAETGFGRLLRSASLFEDIVKVICTCNVTWRQTVAMVDAIVRQWGVPADKSRDRRAGLDLPSEGEHEHGRSRPALQSPRRSARGFPTPARLAGVRELTLRRVARVGYRAGFIRRLARDVADGRLELGPIDAMRGLPTNCAVCSGESTG